MFNQFRRRFVFVFVFVFILFSYFHNIEKFWLNVDEHEWVRRGVVFSELYFFDHNFTSPTWNLFESQDMPKLGEYLYGLWLRGVYGEKMSDVLEEMHFSADWKREDGYASLWVSGLWWVDAASISWNSLEAIPNNFLEAYTIIVTARYLSILFSVGGLAIFYFVAEKYVGYLFAHIAVLYTAFNWIFRSNARQATLDGILFFGMWVSFIGLRLLTKKYKNYKDETLGIVLGSLLFSFAANIKLNGIIFWLSGLLAVDWLAMIGVDKYLKIGVRRLMYRFLISGILLLGIFIVINPITWNSPARGLVKMVETRAMISKVQAKDVTIGELPTYFARLSYILNVYFENTLSTIVFHASGLLEFLLILLGLAWAFYKKMYKTDFFVWNIGILFLMLNYLIVAMSHHVLLLIPFIVFLEVLGLRIVIERLFSILSYLRIRITSRA